VKYVCLIYSLYIRSTNHCCESFYGDLSQTDFELQPLYYNTVSYFEFFIDHMMLNLKKNLMYLNHDFIVYINIMRKYFNLFYTVKSYCCARYTFGELKKNIIVKIDYPENICHVFSHRYNFT